MAPVGSGSGESAGHINAPIIGTTVLFIVLETIASILRVCARRVSKTGFMWSDVYMHASWLVNIGLCTCNFLAIRWGEGQHIDTLSDAEFNLYAMVTSAAFIIYIFAVTFPKLAVCDFYLNIFVDKFSRYTTYFTMLVLVGALIGNLVCFVAPITFLFNAPNSVYYPFVDAHDTWSSFPNIITDLILLILPIPVIVRLHARWPKKVGIMLVFLLGSLGMLTSIARFVEYWRTSLTNTLQDATYSSARLLIWAVVEPGIYHLAACFITYGPLVRWIVHDSWLASRLPHFAWPSRSLRSNTNVS